MQYFFEKMWRIFCQKNLPPSANAEDFEKRTKKIGSRGWGSNPRLTVHRSNHYSTPPSLVNYLKIAYIKKLGFFSSQKKVYKIKIFGYSIARNCVNFGDSVTSSLKKMDKNGSVKMFKMQRKLTPVFPPHFRHLKK